MKQILFVFLAGNLLAAAVSCKSKTSGFVLLDPAATGVIFQNEIVETPENNIMTYQYMYNGAGVAVGDINNDSLPDIYVAGNSVANKLFINHGSWTFEEATAKSNLADRQGDWKTGVSMVDINGDGWLDIYVCYSGNSPGEGLNKPVLVDNPHRANQLFINRGCKAGEVPVFTERAKDFGLDALGTFSTQAYFLDYDRDGDLDMFLLNHANTFYSSLFNTTRLRSLRHPYFGNRLYRNDGNHFVEVSEQAGIHGSGLNYGLSASISDINNDGWPDLYVTNDYDEQDFCYLNNKDGTFKEISKQAFGHLSKYSMGSDAADLNNDLRSDLFVVDMLPEDNHRQKLLKGPDQFDKYWLAVDSGYHHQNMRNTLQLNVGLNADAVPVFQEVGEWAGVSNTDWSWSTLIADFDNDGWKDIFVTNGYLHDYTNLDFLKYLQTEIGPYSEVGVAGNNLLPVIRQMPSTKLNNYIFRNKGDGKFEKKAKDWGLVEKSISNGAAYADFDNDGDLDLLVNRLGDNLALYRNEVVSQENKYLKVRLKGFSPNTGGIGSKVYVTTAGKTFFQEIFFNRGYESSVEPVLTMGLGAVTMIEEIKVVWPDGKISVQKNVGVNQTLVIDQRAAVPGTNAAIPLLSPIFTDVLDSSAIDFRHVENDFVDFKVERLLPYQPSRLGGKVAVGDVNADGNDDLFFGAPAGQSGKLFLGSDEGRYREALSQPWKDDLNCEDMNALFFDADNDKDLDLYIVSGGNEYASGDPLYHDRLYVNDGTGVFLKAPKALPASEATSGSCVKAADFDKDGDLDLFIGGRIAAQMYPLIPKSYLLQNDSGDSGIAFTDITESIANGLQLAGMVSDAVWDDYDSDGWPDLVLVGEWMPIRIFRNERGKRFKEVTNQPGLNGSEGWWATIFAADVDQDGDTDYLLGNAGTNLPYHASVAEPVELYVQDIDGNANLDPVMSYYIQGKSYPAATLDELVDQVPVLRKKFYKYADYADATTKDLIGKQPAGQSLHLKISTLESSWLENMGNGTFIRKSLPAEVQVSMVNGFAIDDFDGDGQKEILCAGNFYPYKVEWGRNDAFMGALMKFKNGLVSVYKPGIRLWFNGDIRDINLVKTKKGRRAVIVARNNDVPGLLQYKM